MLLHGARSFLTRNHVVLFHGRLEPGSEIPVARVNAFRYEAFKDDLKYCHGNPPTSLGPKPHNFLEEHVQAAVWEPEAALPDQPDPHDLLPLFQGSIAKFLE